MLQLFEKQHGFRRDSVSLENWRNRPFNTWAFRNIHEFIPTAEVPATDNGVEEPKVDETWLTSQEIPIGDRRISISAVLQETYADTLVVMKKGVVVAEFHAPGFTTRSRHILFSSSKSVTGMLAGILAGEGTLDPDEPIARHVPELATSAFGDAKVRHALDMRTSLVFNEDYSDPRGDFARYRRAGLLDPALDGEPVETVISFLASLKKAQRDHGGPFFYCSPNSDALGLVVERASGLRFADLLSQKLWQPLGARSNALVTVDREGTARAGGGLFVTARDFARLGELVRREGEVEGRRIIPSEWVRDTVNGGSRDAWTTGNFADWLPSGSYRNQWYQTGNEDGAFFALGIHGQWLFVNPRSEVVIVKFSSQPDPVDDRLKSLNMALFSAISSIV
ncbi:6-aminohexanoate hydrolase [Rhizobium sp. AC27/96]|uniref:serine hydrolase domain-containing protein n=1 Tax=Rhizobium sp. AC27/96 TaxID=1841653 RepID=UPI0008293B85|nr:serine hydrolase [Rhizobium sp. AC27/96]OCJ00578.1 6-aminohexanoate hydrolase [Rhizobium sp. AC27/96]